MFTRGYCFSVGVFSQESDSLFVGLGHIPDSSASNTPSLSGQISVFGKPWTRRVGKRIEVDVEPEFRRFVALIRNIVPWEFPTIIFWSILNFC